MRRKIALAILLCVIATPPLASAAPAFAANTAPGSTVTAPPAGTSPAKGKTVVLPIRAKRALPSSSSRLAAVTHHLVAVPPPVPEGTIAEAASAATAEGAPTASTDRAPPTDAIDFLSRARAAITSWIAAAFAQITSIAGTLTQAEGHNVAYTASAAAPVASPDAVAPATTAAPVPPPIAPAVKPNAAPSVTSGATGSASPINVFAVQSALGILAARVEGLTSLLGTNANAAPSANVESQIAALQSAISSQGYSAVASPPLGGGAPNTIAAAGAIDQLSGTAIANPSITGGSISGAAFSGGPIAANSLSVSGDTSLSGNLSVGGNFAAGSISFSAASSSNSITTNATSTTFFSTLANFTSAVAGTFNASIANITGFTATNATTTNLVATNATTTNFAALGRSYFGGNVGIGTTSPSALLTMDSSNATGTILRISNSSTGGHVFDLLSTGSGNTNGAGRLDIFDSTAGVPRLSVVANGNVGIGTTSPFTNLTVAGSGYFSGNLNVGDPAATRLNLGLAYATSTAAFGTYNVGAWGDSLTSGTYENDLSTLLNGRPVNNFGVGGNTSSQILARFIGATSTWPYATIIWSGRNDYSTYTTTVEPNIAAMVADLASVNNSDYLVLSVLNGDYSWEFSGQSGYNQIVALNNYLSSTYGTHYVDVRSYLVSLYNPSLPLDVIDHAGDVPPTSLHAILDSGTLGGNIGSGDTSFTLNFTTGNLVANEIVSIDGERILVNSISGGSTVTSATRGYNNTTPASHSSGTGFNVYDQIHLNAAGYQDVANYIANALTSVDAHQQTVLTPGNLPAIFAAPLAIGTSISTTTFVGGLTVGSTALAVQQGSGWVGIGNASPAALLDVGPAQNAGNIPVPSGNFVTVRAGGYGSFNTAGIQLSGGFGDSGRSAGFNIESVASGPGAGLADNALTFSNQQSFNGPSTELFRITSGGNLGIGTTSPGSLFSIGGIANFSAATSTLYSAGGINLTGGCFSINGVCINGGSSSAGTTTANTWSQLQTFSSGFISNSSSTVAGNFTASGTGSFSGTTGTTTVAAGQGFTVGGSQLVVQQSSGWVGIGNSSPVAMLHVGPTASPTNIPVPSGNFVTVRAGGYGSFSTAGIQLSGGFGDSGRSAGFNIESTESGPGAGAANSSFTISSQNSYGGAATTLLTLSQSGSVTLSSGGIQFPNGSVLTSADGSGNMLSIAQVSAGGSNLSLGGNYVGNLYLGTGYTGESQALTILNHGNIGIGTSTPYSRLEVFGPDSAASTSAFLVVNNASTTEFNVLDNGNATLAGNLIQNSDQRLKTNIAALDGSSSLAEINALNPVTFNWIDPAKSGVPQFGFIAQDVEKIFPSLVSTTSPTALTPDGTLSLNYIDLISPIVKAIQAISAEIMSIEDTVAGFAQSFTTKQLCVQKSDGTPVCVNGDQLATVLASVNQSSAAPSPSGAADTPPVIAINGDNPAILQVGASYTDLGATITGPQADLNLGIKTYLNGAFVSDIVLDTSAAATDTIDYVATDQNGLTSTSTRTVIVEPAAIPSPPASSAAASSTAATSSTAS